jgi:flavin reductase (DIM6/NTAB) family NADH-FMN oxidoreductase RutF
VFVEILDSNEGVRVSLKDAGDFTTLRVDAPSTLGDDAIGSVLDTAGWGTLGKPGHVWLYIEVIRTHIALDSGDEGHEKLEEMLRYAEKKGWCTDDGKCVEAHIRRVEPVVDTSPVGFDDDQFRHVLGNYPTGVTVVTAVGPDGDPVGMAVGSFTSVSLDPPMVAFLPTKKSSSFPRIKAARSFCINILSFDQEDLCRKFAVSGGDKFAGVAWRPAPSGAPIIDGSVAWIDCIHEQIFETGDHYIAVGKVTSLEVSNPTSPLIFFRGGYGKFAPKSIVVSGQSRMVDQIRLTELIRTDMEHLADSLGVQCVAVGADVGQLVVLGSAGSPAGRRVPARLGNRMPLVPPVGGLFLAWCGRDDVEAWLKEGIDDKRDNYERLLRTIRSREWSVAMSSDNHRRLEDAIGKDTGFQTDEDLEDGIRELTLSVSDQYEPVTIEPDRPYDVTLLSAPIFDALGRVTLTVGLWGLPSPIHGADLCRYADLLVGICRKLTNENGGRGPALSGPGLRQQCGVARVGGNGD